MIASNHEEVEHFLNEEHYKTDEGNDPQKQKAIIDWVRESTNTSSKFKQIVKLARHYGIPFLYLCKECYDQLTSAQRGEFIRELEQIAVLAKWVLGDDIPKELEFLLEGFEVTNSLDHRPAEKEGAFMNYWKSIRMGIAHIRSLSQKDLGVQEEAINTFFERNIRDIKELNVFENFAVGVQIDWVYEHYKNVVELLNAKLFKDLAPSPRKSEINFFPNSEIGSGYQEGNSTEISSEETLTPKKEDQQQNLLPEIGFSRQKSSQQEVPVPICCRRYFYKGEDLQESESLTLEFKDYRYPWNDTLKEEIAKALVGFLNMNGGIIMIGVKQNLCVGRVVGAFYNKPTQQSVHSEIIRISRSITPNILSKCKVQFVPLRNPDTEQFISGAYVIRINVQPGERDRVYFFKKHQVDMYMFRTEKSVEQLTTEQALERQIAIARKSLDMPIRLHNGPCKQPEIGGNICQVREPEQVVARPYPAQSEKNKKNTNKFNYLVAIGLPCGQGKKWIAKALKSITDEDKLIADGQHIAVLAYPKVAEETLRRNLLQVQRVTLLVPSTSLSFNDISEMFDAHRAIGKKSPHWYDKKEVTITFDRIEDALRAFIHLVNEGFTAYFSPGIPFV